MVRASRILRVSSPGELVSADAFEKLFVEHIGTSFLVDELSISSLFAEIVKCYPQGFGKTRLNLEEEQFWAEKIALYDFFSPGFGAFFMAPFFLEKRNRTGLKTRLLFIAHAPGALVMEWALIAPLLRPGDLIIAPSSNAGSVIKFIVPSLSFFIKVIPHPVHPLPAPSWPSLKTSNISPSLPPINRFVSLSRIHPDKLIHRQIEAFAILCQQGDYENLELEIVGPLSDRQGCELLYSRTLKALIKRLGLGDRVKLRGSLYGDQSKADLFNGARALLNLSITVEESFGKSIVEALSSGLPVVCSDWNGFNETLGEAGLLVPVTFESKDNPDIRPEDLAKAMTRILRDPPMSANCRVQAERSQPKKIAVRYQQVLNEALSIIPQKVCIEDESSMAQFAFDRVGLLSVMAPLQVFPYAEVFAFYLDLLYENMEVVAGSLKPGREICPGAIIQNILSASTNRPLSCFLAHHLEAAEILANIEDEIAIMRVSDRAPTPLEDDFFWRLATTVNSFSTQRSKEISLLYCALNHQFDALRFGLQELSRHGLHSNAITYLEIELKIYDNLLIEAYELAFRALDRDIPTEFDFVRLRQLAKIARKMKAPEKALQQLDSWLERFPDALNSGVVWLDLCANAVAGGVKYRTVALRAFAKADKLLGDIPALQKLAVKIGGMI